MRKSKLYRRAIEWLATYDDNDWLSDPNGSPSVSASLVADLFGWSDVHIRADLIAEIERQARA